MNTQAYTANRDALVRDFVNTAKKNKFWIYNPDSKQWYTPEEFEDSVKRLDHLKDGWLEKYKIMNPQKGLAAAEIQAQQLNKKKLAFQQKVIDYFQNQPK